jgi:hypothetical protein
MKPICYHSKYYKFILSKSLRLDKNNFARFRYDFDGFHFLNQVTAYESLTHSSTGTQLYYQE